MIADNAQRRLDIETARRRKSGEWVVAIQKTVWESDGVSRCADLAVEVCNGRDRAEQRARELLKEHAHEYAIGSSVEPAIMPRIEWDDPEALEPDPAEPEAVT